MEHRKERHTCDRCGVEIDRMPENSFKGYLIQKKSTEVEMEFEEVCKSIGATPCESTKIYATFSRSNKTFDLCPKCSKAFKEFMKNDC